ncbi:MAG TPA: radical SAM protein, partial [Polyangiaceae bacterium]|nr:radical SAM protein [Polyangiaceae bacterium]
MSKLLSTATRTGELALTALARGAWSLLEESLSSEPARPAPAWAPRPLMHSKERTKPPLGWPRTTDSLCPRCVKEAREAVINDQMEMETFLHQHPGEIKAHIIERDGKIWMVKDCPHHGHFEDVIAMDPAFLRRIEELFPGRDFESPKTKLRDHGTSTIKYGRGSVLTVDLTNRCNMMCDPCFMDGNQVGYVHELSWDDVKQILDDSLSIKPRRQLSVQFSGGEPTLSPDFFRAIEYARDIGYFCVQCAS